MLGTVRWGAIVRSLALRSRRGVSSRSHPVTVQDVKQEGDDPLQEARRPSTCDIVSWKLAGPASPIHSASPSRINVAHGQLESTAATIPGTAMRDLVEVARVDANLVAPTVDLDA